MRNIFLPFALTAGLIWGLITPSCVQAQSSPGLYNGQVPTAGQWNSYFTAKQDYNAGFFGAPYIWTAPQTWSAQATFGAHVAMTGASPAVSSCGTSPSIIGSDSAGEVTTGTATPTACTITFAVAYAAQPICDVRDRTVAANITSYTVSASAIVVTNTAASSQKIVYICFGA